MSKLRWQEREGDSHSSHGRRLALVRELLALRHRHLVPRLAGASRGGRFEVDGDCLQVQWPLGHGATAAEWHLVANLGRVDVISKVHAGRTIYACGPQTATAAGRVLAPNAVHVTLQTAPISESNT
ncbi:MAG: malto-oligosyltrehalose trehalohydrolase, partial [Rhodoferax sp.]|nr:malto-oligosyltrehalose trehalohydrolase [Rhodoferax sp.]